ncbi:uncharacterized protein LOC116248104 isoform X1 [Nymphaea colorata]|nr:uncharacterized protein LOC116248104 isoform X1 [Nymphaea colorata]
MAVCSIAKRKAWLLIFSSWSRQFPASRFATNFERNDRGSKLRSFHDILPPRAFSSVSLVSFPPSDCSSSLSNSNETKVEFDSHHGKEMEETKGKRTQAKLKRVDFRTIEVDMLPTVVILGRPNVGKSALFNRLIKRREALVYNTPAGHVTRDIREGVAKLGDLRFKVLDSAGLETASSPVDILMRTSEMTRKVLPKSAAAIFLIDARAGLQPLDMDVGKWLRKHAPSGTPIILAMNKSELLDDGSGSLAAAAGEAHALGFGEPLPISAETGLGMADLYEILHPLLEEYVLQNNQNYHDNLTPLDNVSNTEDGDAPLQLAIVGCPNVGKSTLLNALLLDDRVLVGPESGLTRDSIRAHFYFQGRKIYLVDTAGWLQRTKQERGPASLSIVQSRKHLMRANIVALVLDAEEIAKAKCSMRHAEVVIARRAIEEGRGLVVVVNKMDLLRGKKDPKLSEKVITAVREEIQTVLPQVTGIPVVFVSALEGRGRMAVMRRVIDTYEKWCLRLPTARLNRWLRKVMSRHSWKDLASQPKIKYFTQVKARPPTFVAFTSGSVQLSDTDIRFLMKSLKEDFDMGGIPIRIIQRNIPRKTGHTFKESGPRTTKFVKAVASDKRVLSRESPLEAA